MLRWGSDKPFLLDRKIISLTIFGFICAIILAGLVNLSISTQSGVRAYVAAQSKLIKSHKQSLIFLSNFIYSGNEEMFVRFHKSNEAIIGGMRAHVDMVNGEFNSVSPARGVEVGYFHPEDFDDMSSLYRWFSWVPQVEKAFTVWQQGNAKNNEIIQFANSIHSRYNLDEVNKDQIDTWIAAVLAYEYEFDQMETEFTEAMGEMARLVNSVLRWSTVTLAFLLFGMGGLLLMRFSKSAKSWAQTLQDNEEKFRTMLNSSRDVMYKMSLGEEEKYEYVSGGLKEMIGYETEEFLNGGPKWIYSKIHPEDKENMARVIERYKQINKDHFMPLVEFRLQDVNGNYKWVSNSRRLMKDADGNPQAIVGTVRDISEIKEQEARLRKSLTDKEILLQEIHHRVKNNLSIVISLLELQKDGLDEDMQQMLADTQSRIKSIANVHEKLYKSTTLSEIPMDIYITELAEEISKAYATSKKKISMEIDIEPFVMNLNEAIPCGLVLNELINNSYKHGFKGLNEGTLRISFNKKDECMELVVENNGNKLPDDFDPMESKSLGMTLIQVLIQRFNGELIIERGEWTSFRICFKV